MRLSRAVPRQVKPDPFCARREKLAHFENCFFANPEQDKSYTIIRCLLCGTKHVIVATYEVIGVIE
jgi:hypothetical protein